MRRRASTLVAGLLGLGCLVADAPELGECGNGIVEPAAGEDCEPVGDAQRCGAAGTGSRACRFVCDADACPDGFRCGLDEVCRRPCVGHEGEPSCSAFEMLSTDVTTVPIADLAVLDVDADEALEIVAVEVDGEGGGSVRIHRREGDAFVAGATTAPTGSFPLLTRLDADGPMYLFAQLGDRQGVVSVVDDALGFREVLIQGPIVVDGGAIALGSFALPADVPGGGDSYVFGFRDGAVWEREPVPIDLVADGDPEELLGPVFGQPIADPGSALASRHCDAMIYGYAGTSSLRAVNPCEGRGPGWNVVPLALPVLPDDARFGDGLVFGDANGDTLPDLVAASSDGRIHVAYAVGDGSFHSDPASWLVTEGDGRFDAGVGMPDGSPLAPIAVGDFNADAQPDFITQSTWIRSCTIDGCGTCDAPGYRCDAGFPIAPIFDATAGSVVDRDGDGDLELAVVARGPEDWGPIAPAAGDLVVVEAPASEAWTASAIEVPVGAAIADSGDLDGDGRDDIVLVREDDGGDELVVVFAADEEVERTTDFSRIVDAHVVRGTSTLAVVSEDADGSHRRLSVLTATVDHRLRSTTKLDLAVAPRQFVAGRFAANGERGIAVIGENDDGDVAVELLTRGDGNFFDASARTSAVTGLGLAPEHAPDTRGIAVDLDGDEVDEVVVFAADGFVRTLKVRDAAFDDVVRRDAVAESYAAPAWPAATIGSSPSKRDLDGDGDADVWLLTAEDPPRLAAFRNRGDGSLDVAGRALTPTPEVALSICESTPDDCHVRIADFAPFAGTSDRSLAISPSAVDLVLVSHRALFVRTLDPLAPESALDLEEVAVVHGPREPLGPPGAQVHVRLADIDGDGVDDVIAGGASGIRWLRGLAVNP